MLSRTLACLEMLAYGGQQPISVGSRNRMIKRYASPLIKRVSGQKCTEYMFTSSYVV